MIDRRTVYILGAGASFPYGFPLGAGLRTEILNVKPADLHQVKFSNAGIVPKIEELTSQFKQAFEHSKSPSIDAFLANRTEFSEIGRIAIAKVLLSYERVKTLYADERNDDWLGAVLNSMRCPKIEDFLKNQVSFVTFNYDRSLELTLLNFVRHNFNHSEGDALKVVESFPIIHVYGSLGSLNPSSKNFVPYGGGTPSRSAYVGVFGDDNGHAERERYRQHLRWVASAASEIRVIPEHRDDVEPNHFSRAKELIANAERVVMLGFAFDDLNVRRLSPELPTAIGRLENEFHGDAVCCAATIYGMAQAEVLRVARGLAREAHRLRQFRLHNMTSLQMLRHTGIHICD
ncbi:hypothetical protein ACNI65_11365 [Roseateles sp. So40a]|uniref:hypothetical protein n=1 Tax=Roseateles sp. So40a TaxID=3400226 RepID=UPI003A85E2B1